MSTGHTHRLPSVEKGREPDLTAEGTTQREVAHPGRDFFWGVATSGYQSEGGYNGPGEPLNNWAWAEQNGDVVPSGRTADFWTLSHEDFGRCREMGLNAFRPQHRVDADPALDRARRQGRARSPSHRRRHSTSARSTVTRSGSPIATHTNSSQSSPCIISSIRRGSGSTHGSSPRRSSISSSSWSGQSPIFSAPCRKISAARRRRWFITINEPNLQAF